MLTQCVVLFIQCNSAMKLQSTVCPWHLSRECILNNSIKTATTTRCCCFH